MPCKFTQHEPPAFVPFEFTIPVESVEEMRIWRTIFTFTVDVARALQENDFVKKYDVDPGDIETVLNSAVTYEDYSKFFCQGEKS